MGNSGCLDSERCRRRAAKQLAALLKKLIQVLSHCVNTPLCRSLTRLSGDLGEAHCLPEDFVCGEASSCQNNCIGAPSGLDAHRTTNLLFLVHTPTSNTLDLIKTAAVRQSQT